MTGTNCPACNRPVWVRLQTGDYICAVDGAQVAYVDIDPDTPRGYRWALLVEGEWGPEMPAPSLDEAKAAAEAAVVELGDRVGADPAEWPEHLRVREMPLERTP